MNAPFPVSASVAVPQFLWRLRPYVHFERLSDGGARLSAATDGQEILKVSSPALIALLSGLVYGMSEAQLLAEANVGAGEAAATALYQLRRLIDGKLVEAAVMAGDETAAIFEPCRPGFDIPELTAIDLPANVKLDRFVCLRTCSRGLLLEHPEAPCQITLLSPALGNLAVRLASGICTAEALGDPLAHQFTQILAAFGFVADCEAPETPARQMWEFHDFYFHRASRAYGDWQRRSSTYRFKDRLPAPPAFRTDYTGENITLPPPESAQFPASSPCAEVMARRRSVRSFSEQAVSLEVISALLHRVARATSPLTDRAGQDCYLRPVPAGGGIQAVEVYLAVRDGQTLAPGFYHYLSGEHSLTHIAGAEAPTRDMLAHAAGATRQTEPPPILAVLAARLPRLAWKYEGLAYHLALLDAGVMLQALYLATTDLGLGGCAIGLGDSAAFLRATQSSAFEEVTVAEFALGHALQI
ncbi:MAG: SagB/ThcOx family dehydrogenase [Alphaproteobacteria bacterium]